MPGVSEYLLAKEKYCHCLLAYRSTCQSDIVQSRATPCTNEALYQPETSYP